MNYVMQLKLKIVLGICTGGRIQIAIISAKILKVIFNSEMKS